MKTILKIKTETTDGINYLIGKWVSFNLNKLSSWHLISKGTKYIWNIQENDKNWHIIISSNEIDYFI